MSSCLKLLPASHDVPSHRRHVPDLLPCKPPEHLLDLDEHSEAQEVSAIPPWRSLRSPDPPARLSGYQPVTLFLQAGQGGGCTQPYSLLTGRYLEEATLIYTFSPLHLGHLGHLPRVEVDRVVAVLELHLHAKLGVAHD